MIELVIAFLLSIGWVPQTEIENIKVDQYDDATFGVVNTDGVQQKIVVYYDEESNTFFVK